MFTLVGNIGKQLPLSNRFWNFSISWCLAINCLKFCYNANFVLNY
jgi:hypothetical protein